MFYENKKEFCHRRLEKNDHLLPFGCVFEKICFEAKLKSNAADFHFKVEFATSKYMVKVLRGETNLMIWVRVLYLSQMQ